MLAEAVLYALTRASAPGTDAVALNDSVGLWSRRGRCRAAWAGHEARSRAAILAAAAPLAVRRTAVVLGSGLLADVPIEELARSFQKVVLVDLCHLACVRLRALFRGWRNVEFRRLDLSGYDRLVEQSRIKMATGQSELGAGLDALGFLRRVPDLDLVVSANLLSQLAVGAGRRLQSADGHAAIMPEDTVAEIVAAHLDGLAAVHCKTCLVSDISYVRRRRDGLVMGRVDLLYGIRPPEAFDSWEWTVAPFGEESADLERVHRVIAAEDVALAL